MAFLWLQVMLLWTFAYIIHPQWIIPLGLELVVGMDRWPAPNLMLSHQRLAMGLDPISTCFKISVHPSAGRS